MMTMFQLDCARLPQVTTTTTERAGTLQPYIGKDLGCMKQCIAMAMTQFMKLCQDSYGLSFSLSLAEAKNCAANLSNHIGVANGGGRGYHMSPQNARRGALPLQIFANIGSYALECNIESACATNGFEHRH